MEFNDLEEREHERLRQHIEEMKEEIARLSGIPDGTYLSPDPVGSKKSCDVLAAMRAKLSSSLLLILRRRA